MFRAAMGHFLVHFLGYSLGFLWTLSQTEGLLPLRLPGAARYGYLTSRELFRTFERLLVGGTTNL